jgi:hypothetical protein
VLASQGSWLRRSGTQGTSGASAAKGRMIFSIQVGATASSCGDGRRAARGASDVRSPSDCPAQHGGAKRHPCLWSWSWHGLARDSEGALLQRAGQRLSVRAYQCASSLGADGPGVPGARELPRGCSVHAVRRWICWCLARRLVPRPNVRGEAGPTAQGQAREAHDRPERLAGLVLCRWASPRPRG